MAVDQRVSSREADPLPPELMATFASRPPYRWDRRGAPTIAGLTIHRMRGDIATCETGERTVVRGPRKASST
jgi:hypothetical protein